MEFPWNQKSRWGFIVKPRISPRDTVDVVVGLFFVLPIQLGVMFALPAGLAWWLTASEPLGFGIFVAIYLAFLSFAVWWMEISVDGVRFVRLFGSPKFLPWCDIVDISEASRAELVLRGWLWPLFPAREMSPSLSSLGHFRIRWNGGFCYFPPEHVEEFRRQIADCLAKRDGTS